MKYIPVAGLIGSVIGLSVMMSNLLMSVLVGLLGGNEPYSKFSEQLHFWGSILAILLVWQMLRVVQKKNHFNNWLLTILFSALIIMTQIPLPEQKGITSSQLFYVFLTQDWESLP